MERIINYPGSDHHPPKALDRVGTRPLERPEPLVRVQDIAYVLFEKPDLDRQLAFLRDFGMHPVQTDVEAIYLRGCGSSPWFYSARRGEHSRYLGAGFVVDHKDDLTRISEATGIGIDEIEEPGGGRRVRLRDPDGLVVDIVHGREQVERLPCRREPLSFNTPWHKGRVNQRANTELVPTDIERLGHTVFGVTDFAKSAQWYMRHLGLIPTDVQCVSDGSPMLAFFRCDRGATPADHHTVVLTQNLAAKGMHTAYETLDIDSIGQGAQYLRWKGWKHYWGIGRHILGSQLFDYWLDPFGDEVEHYADGDMFDADQPTQYHLFDRGGLWAWGDDRPPEPKPSPLAILRLLLGGRRGEKPLPKALLGRMRRALSLPARPWLD